MPRLLLLITSFCLGVGCASVSAQQMRTDLAQLRLNGQVECVKTYVVSSTRKSYKLLPNNKREELQDFGTADQLAADNPKLRDMSRFDREGKLVEDIDVERSLIEQKSYRYVYVYDSKGVLTEEAGYREDGSFDEGSQYIYGPNGKKSEELIYSSTGKLQSKLKFDERENVVSIISYGVDGRISANETHRYEYVRRGTTLEQIYFHPDPFAGRGITVYPPIGADAQKTPTTTASMQWRTQFVYDAEGRLREESSFEPGGSLFQKKVFDENGTLRSSEFRMGEMSVTVATYDAEGKEIESHTTAKKGLGSSRAVDDRTFFSYDSHGNLTKMTTTAPDGSLIGETSNVFEYDGQGNWVKRVETVLDNAWQTDPFPAAFETITEYQRSITYFQNR